VLTTARAMEFLRADLFDQLRSEPRRWLVTGAAGFIGSNIVQCLLSANQDVVGFDNFATGHQRNLDEATEGAGYGRLRMITADIRDRDACRAAVEDVDIILHQAALGSVPRSIVDPLTSHDVNVTGFINMLDAARQAGVRRFVYAASSSTYGDDPNLPKVEDRIGDPLSPYAATKRIDEVYASAYAKAFGIKATGLRYFNVFGPRQDPESAYAAVIPKWVSAMLRGEDVVINGDGETSRDFCFVANAVQANIRAAFAPEDAQGEVYNVAFGERTSLNQLFGLLREGLGRHQVHYPREPVHADFRPGDMRHSLADIGKAERLLDYQPTYSLGQGIEEALPWYIDRFR
jgi:UDP-N-acetylglucosamine 4-epimerase